MSSEITCFKAYDVRGKVPDQLNNDVAYRIGKAFAEYLGAKRVAVGRDARLTGPELCNSLSAGLQDGGADVLDIGQCGTEEIYFATFDQELDGGICVTASHNPQEYNGLKMVGQKSRPICGETELPAIKTLAESYEQNTNISATAIKALDIRARYVQHLLSYIDTSQLKPLKIVVNAGNGAAGPVIDLLETALPFEFIKVHHEADGTFPNGIPNPMLPENRQPTVDAVREHKADLGIAWDGDFDRCFFFDETGAFIEGYYIVGLLAKAFLAKNPNANIVYDPRLIWNSEAMISGYGGHPVLSKTGHGYIKQTMRSHDAVYGGEISAHHYFKDFAYCDSGMIPWLLVAELIIASNKPLSELVRERMYAFPCSGEINRKVEDVQVILERLEQRYNQDSTRISHTDGLSMEFERWRFNVRASSTEPLLRINIESRADTTLLAQKTQEVLNLIDAQH